MSRLRFSVLAASVALLLGFSTFVPAASADDSAPEIDPMTGAPQAGQCYLTTAKQNLSTALEQAPIACTRRHTLWVLGSVEASAVQLADLMSGNGWDKLLRTCARWVTKAVGSPKRQALSAYQPHLFVPTAAQQAAGARWMSCSVGIEAKAPKLRVSRDAEPVRLGGSMPTKARSCIASKRFTHCAAKHSWRAVHAEPVTWPRSQRKAVKLAQRVCGPKVSSPRFHFRGYVAGPRMTTYLVCYTKSR